MIVKSEWSHHIFLAENICKIDVASRMQDVPCYMDPWFHYVYNHFFIFEVHTYNRDWNAYTDGVRDENTWNEWR